MSTPATPTSIPTSSCPDSPTPTSPRSLRRRQRQSQPQPLRQQPAAEGSLRSLLLQHSSKRLYVHPFEWTALHLSLLCCNVIIDQLNIRQRPSQQCLSQTETPRLPLTRTPGIQDALDILQYLQWSDGIGDRNTYSTKLITLLGFRAQPDCQISPGYVNTLAYSIFKTLAKYIARTLMLRYNQKSVCRLRLPLMAWHKGKLRWAYINSTWIDKLHEKHKPRKNFFDLRKKRAKNEEGLLISPFCMAIMIAMAQQVPPQQQVCLYLSPLVPIYPTNKQTLTSRL